MPDMKPHHLSTPISGLGDKASCGFQANRPILQASYLKPPFVALLGQPLQGATVVLIAPLGKEVLKIDMEKQRPPVSSLSTQPIFGNLEKRQRISGGSSQRSAAWALSGHMAPRSSGSGRPWDCAIPCWRSRPAAPCPRPPVCGSPPATQSTVRAANRSARSPPAILDDSRRTKAENIPDTAASAAATKALPGVYVLTALRGPRSRRSYRPRGLFSRVRHCSSEYFHQLESDNEASSQPG